MVAATGPVHVTELVPNAVGELLRFAAPEPDDVLEEMEAVATETGFPTVGPDVGAFLRLCARTVGATSVFEFGSGFGYSAYWVAPALPPGGRVVLTEYDLDLLDAACGYLARGGYDGLAVFEAGDALAAAERYDGPFDLVLIDNEDERYVEAFDAVRGKVAPGGVVIADNVLAAADHFGPEDVLAVIEGEDGGSTKVGGIADYYRRVRDDPDFETALVPLGEGVLASVRV